MDKATIQLLITIGCSLLSGIIGSLAVIIYDHYKEHRISRNVAFAVVFSLQKEVEAGLRLIELTKEGKRTSVGNMPTNGWNSLQSLLSDRNIVDAILRYGEGGKVADPKINTTYGDKKFEPYCAKEFLSHLKNYFCYIVPQSQGITKEHFRNPQAIAELYVGAADVDLMLRKILNGLSK